MQKNIVLDIMCIYTVHIHTEGGGDELARLYKSECYCTNMRRSAKAISDIYSDALSEVNLTAPQYYLLINLKRMESANMSDWSKRVGLDRSTIIRNSKHLLEKGMIEQAEGHGKVFKLSQKGEGTVKRAEVIWEKTQHRMLNVLGKDDAEALIRISEKLQDILLDEDMK